MRKMLILWLLFSPLPAMSQNGGSLLSDRMAAILVIPPGWAADTSFTSEIILTGDSTGSIFVSIKRYEIEKDRQISSADDLVVAIAGLYKQIGIDGIEKENIKYSLVDGTAVFEYDFDGYDPARNIQYRKYLKGIVVRKAGNGQVLYLMIAGAPRQIYDSLIPQFKVITSSFRCTEALSQELFPASHPFGYLLILLLAGLSVFFFMRNRRIQKSRNPLGRNSGNFWRCGSCGRVNHADSHTCHRCGAEKVTVTAPKI